ncbi:MAG: MoxR family ATPase [Dehalococcoidales bacterium]|nr:MoxR family ATPase [Dehalococcoidales bacterium]
MDDSQRISDLYQRIKNEISKVIIGKSEIERAMLLALIAGGHVLIEGLPGTAKTKLANTFAEVIGGDFKRIQFTPDMMPADITGFYVYSPDGTSRFVEGPIFAHIVLADELNRTTPRTQAALLEAMQEYQVTIEGKRYSLDKPFMVIATQVPTGGEGTYPLTDVQVDRFLLMVKSEYPTKEEEKRIINEIDRIDEPDIKPVTQLEEILHIQKLAKAVHVSPDIIEYVTSIVTSIRTDPDVLWGPSVRASIAVYKCSRVLALLDGRDYVIPDDIKELLMNTIEHRIRVKPEAEMDDITPRAIITKILEKTPVPKPKT